MAGVRVDLICFLRCGSCSRPRGGSCARLRYGSCSRPRGGSCSRPRGGPGARVRGGSCVRVRGGSCSFTDLHLTFERSLDLKSPHTYGPELPRIVRNNDSGIEFGLSA